MFSRLQLLASPSQIADYFGTQSIECDFNPTQIFNPAQIISAFGHQPHPIITDSNTLECYRWGLVPPDWKKSPESIWNRTISAKLEYIERRYSWRQVSLNRCLVPATAYYEYHWNDPKGKSKTRFKINHARQNLFFLAGLYSKRMYNGISLNTFAVCTTNGNQIMQFVHNKDAAKNYARMPVMLNAGDELRWLDRSVSHLDFAFPNYQPELIANPESDGLQGGLF